MCLIVYSPDGRLLDRDVFDAGTTDNPDGIGIMSTYAVERFVGKGSRRKAWRLMERLAHERIPYAIHFRWRTHGPINTELCHPFKSPDGYTYVMHNGVIGATARYAEAHESDTSVFVRDFVDFSSVDSEVSRASEVAAIESLIGYGNKLVMLDMRDGRFTICNADAGLWDNGIWYSNEYSLPARMQTWTYARNTSYAYPPVLYSGNGKWLPVREWEEAAEDREEREVQQRKRGNSRWIHQKAEMIPIDSEDSYYRSFGDDTGIHDYGIYLGERAAQAAEEEDYKELIRLRNAAGMGR